MNSVFSVRRPFRFLLLFAGILVIFQGTSLFAQGTRMETTQSPAAPASASAPTPGTPASWTPDPEITALIASNPDLLDQKILQSMANLLNNPKRLEIKVARYDPVETSRGHLKEVRVITEGALIDNLTLATATIDFFDVTLDTTKLFKDLKLQTVEVKNIDMDVILIESDLNAFLAAKARKIKVDDPKIELKPGHIELSGSTKYSFVKVKFWATGVFAVVDSKQVWFHPKKLKVNHMTMPRAFVGTIVKKINPVLNLEKFPFRLNLKEIRIEQGALHFTSFQNGK